jgi:hypothetical protein
VEPEGPRPCAAVKNQSNLNDLKRGGALARSITFDVVA